MLAGLLYCHRQHQLLGWNKLLIAVRQQLLFIQICNSLSHSSFNSLDTRYSGILFASFSGAQSANHFQAASQTLCCSSNVALKSASMMQITAQTGPNFSNSTLPHCMMQTTLTTLMALMPSNRLKFRGLPRIISRSLVAVLPVVVRILTVLLTQQTWLAPINILSMLWCQHGQWWQVALSLPGVWGVDWHWCFIPNLVSWAIFA